MSYQNMLTEETEYSDFFALEDSRLNKDKENSNVWNTEPLRLRVIQSNGVTVEPNHHITVSDLNTGGAIKGFMYKHFHSNGFGGITFKIQVIIGKDDVWYSPEYVKYADYDDDNGNHSVLRVVKEWIRDMVPVKVVTRAIDVPNQNYIITKNSSRKQTSQDYTIWELEFVTYVPITSPMYKNDNTRVKKAIKSAKAKKVTAKTKKSKPKSTNKSLLKKCKLSSLKYSKKKKQVKCVKYLQKILKKKGYYKGKIDKWYGPMTKTAVQKFQKAYNKKIRKSKKKKTKLPTNGKVDKNTRKALCE